MPHSAEQVRVWVAQTAASRADSGMLSQAVTPELSSASGTYSDVQTEQSATASAGQIETTWEHAAAEFARDFAAPFAELAHEPVHLYFDTLEVREAATKAWLLNELLPALRHALPKLVVVVAGQRTFEIEAGGTPTLPEAQRATVQLQPFSDAEAESFLRQAGGVNNPAEIAAVLRVSDGLPILLSMAARTRALGAAPIFAPADAGAVLDASEPERRRFLYTRIVARLRVIAPPLVELLQQGALLRHFDQQVLSAALDRSVTDEEWASLRAWPFIQEAARDDEDTTHAYSMHEVMRDIQRTLSREQLTADAIIALHRRAAAHITTEVRAYAPEKRAAQIEQIILDGLYHLCHADDLAALRGFLLDQYAEALESANDENLEFCSTMLTMVRAELVPLPEELEDLIGVLQAGRDAVAHRTYAAALAMLEVLLAHPTVRPALLPALRRALATVLARYHDSADRARAILQEMIAADSDDAKTQFALATLEAETGRETAAIDVLHELISFGGLDAVHAHIELARVYAKMHQRTSAEVALSSALSFAAQLEDAAERASACEHVGTTYYHTLRAVDNAILAYKEALAAQPNRESAVLKLVEVYRQLQRWDDVADAYRQLAAISPDEKRPFYLNQAALAVMHTGKVDEAELALQRLIREHPRALEGYAGLAEFYEHQRRWPDAREMHLTVADRFVDQYTAACIKALLCLYRMGHTEDAEAELIALRAEYPHDLTIAAGASLFYRELQRWDDAIIALRIIVAHAEEAGRRAQALVTLGDLHLGHRDDLEQAVAAYREALEIDPGRHAALMGLVQAYEEHEQWDQAREIHQQLGRAVPRYRVVAETRAAVCLSRAGDDAGAETELRRLREMHPYNVQVVTAEAEIYERQELWDNAIADYDEIARLDEDRAVEALLAIERIFRQRGMDEDADEVLREAEERAEQLRESGQQLLKMAVRQHQMGNIETAIQLLHKAAERDPDNVHPVYTNLGMIYIGQHRYDEAQAMFDQAIEAHPERVQPHMGLAQLFEAQQRWYKAIAANQRVAEISSTHAALAWERIGNIYRDHLRDLEQAEASYQQAMTFDAQRAETHIALALAYEAFERWDEAIAAHRKVGEVEPRLQVISVAKVALCMAKNGQIEEADAELQRQHITHPNSVALALARAQLYEVQGRYEDAVAMQETVIELDPEQAAGAYMKIGAYYKQLGQQEHARAAFQQAEQAAGALRESGKQLLQLAVAQQRMGNLDEAEALLRKSLERDPESQHPAYTNLGSLYAQRRQFDQAQAMYAKAIEIDPARVEPYGGMARVLQEQGRWIEAIEVYQQVAELAAGHRSAAWEQIGILYRRQIRDYDKAEAAIKQALTAEPHRVNALIELAFVYEDAQRWDDAISVHRQVAESQLHLRAVANAKAALCVGKSGEIDDAETELQQLRATYPEDAQVVLALAQLYEHAERWDDAIATQRQLGAMSPDHAMETQLKIGQLHQHKGDEEQAQVAFQQAETLAASSQEEESGNVKLMQLAVMQQRLGNLEEAEKLLHDILDGDPELHHVALSNLGSVYTTQERYDDAEQMFFRAMALAPERAEPYIGLANCYRAQKRWQEVIETYQRIAEQAPEHQGIAWEKIGDIYRDELKDYPAAETAYKHALELEPQRISAHIGLAYAYEAAERWGEAADEHLYVGEITTQYRVVAQAKAAMCFNMAGQTEKAEADLLTLRREHPDNVPVALALAQVYDYHRRWDDLKAVIDDLHGIAPDHPQVMVLTANYHEGRGDWEAAIAAHKRVVEHIEEHKSVAESKIAVALARLGRTDEARTMLEQLEADYGDDTNILIQIARLHEMLDDDADTVALEVYATLETLVREALIEDESDMHYRRLAWLLYKTGRLDDAVEAGQQVNLAREAIDPKRARVILAAIALLRGDLEQMQDQLVDCHLRADLVWEGQHDIAVVARRTASSQDLTPFNTLLEDTL
ncbi:MAG: tetratricopeptide repeat protein [Anaerolineae bacterium]|nr:tetratricopeptide repeat protein [Anaerolineae bacterium]